MPLGESLIGLPSLVLPVCCWLSAAAALLLLVGYCCCWRLAAVGWLLLLLLLLLADCCRCCCLLLGCCWCCCLLLAAACRCRCCGLGYKAYSFAACHSLARPMIIAGFFHCRLGIGNVISSLVAGLFGETRCPMRKQVSQGRCRDLVAAWCPSS